jgi:hypothetical protein
MKNILSTIIWLAITPFIFIAITIMAVINWIDELLGISN